MIEKKNEYKQTFVVRIVMVIGEIQDYYSRLEDPYSYECNLAPPMDMLEKL